MIEGYKENLASQTYVSRKGGYLNSFFQIIMAIVFTYDKISFSIFEVICNVESEALSINFLTSKPICVFCALNGYFTHA